MAEPTNEAHRIIVVSADQRVLVALAALINATPGMLVVARTNCLAYASTIFGSGGANAAVVEVGAAHPDADLATIRELARRVPVVAVCDVSEGPGALAAGATACCDKGTDPDRLVAVVAAAAGAGC